MSLPDPGRDRRLSGPTEQRKAAPTYDYKCSQCQALISIPRPAKTPDNLLCYRCVRERAACPTCEE